jgi:hypothetical protein
MKENQQSVGNHKITLYKQPLTPYWTMRVMVEGKRRSFSTRESNKRKAELKAKIIMADIQSQGFAEAVRIHSPRKSSAETKDDELTRPTCQKICELYNEANSTWDSAPKSSTIAQYIACFEKIYKHAKALHLDELDDEALEKYAEAYRKKAASQGRDAPSARRTLNSAIRKASSLFSKKALKYYSKRNYTIANPFDSFSPKKEKKASYKPLKRKIVNKIWKKAYLLRDGNPKAPEPDKKIPARRPPSGPS